MNYNDLTRPNSPQTVVYVGTLPPTTLFQVGELLWFTQVIQQQSDASDLPWGIHWAPANRPIDMTTCGFPSGFPFPVAPKKPTHRGNSFWVNPPLVELLPFICGGVLEVDSAHPRPTSPWLTVARPSRYWRPAPPIASIEPTRRIRV